MKGKEVLIDGVKYKNREEFAKAYCINTITAKKYLNSGAIERIKLLDGYKYGARLEWMDRRIFRNLILIIPIKDKNLIQGIEEIVVNNKRVVRSKVYLYNNTKRKTEAQIFMLLDSHDIQIPLNIYQQIRDWINHQAG